MLKSKYSFKAYYLSLIVFTFLFLVPSLLFLCPDKISRHQHTGNTATLAPLGIGMFALALLGYYLILNIKRLTINSDGLVVRSLWHTKKIGWESIEKIDLLTSGEVLLQTMEATSIQIKSGEKIVLAEAFYRNMHNLRLVLGRAAALLEQRKEVSTRLDFSLTDTINNADSAEEESAEVFSDSYILSLKGFIFLGIVATPIIAVCTANKLDPPGIIAGIFFLLLFYFVFGSQAYYFLVSDNHLIIKNHLFRWYRKVYALEEITDAKLEHVYKRSTILRVTTKDFQSKPFSAGSLRNNTWRALLDRLSAKGISVRNEVF